MVTVTTASSQPAWLAESGSIGAPSDILVEREGDLQHQTDRAAFQPLPAEFSQLSLQERTGPPAEDPYGTHSSGRPYVGAGGYSRDYWRNITGPDYHRPALSPGPATRHPSPVLLNSSSSPHLASGSGSPGRALLKPSSGSPASEASKSPQRSPRPYRPGSTYQNPIGTVYHEPTEGEGTGWGWDREEDRRWAAAQAGEGWSSTRLSEEDRAFAGRNMVRAGGTSGLLASPPRCLMRASPPHPSLDTAGRGSEGRTATMSPQGVT
jgi:hypothetical protein